MPKGNYVSDFVLANIYLIIKNRSAKKQPTTSLDIKNQMQISAATAGMGLKELADMGCIVRVEKRVESETSTAVSRIFECFVSGHDCDYCEPVSKKMTTRGKWDTAKKTRVKLRGNSSTARRGGKQEKYL